MKWTKQSFPHSGDWVKATFIWEIYTRTLQNFCQHSRNLWNSCLACTHPSLLQLSCHGGSWGREGHSPGWAGCSCCQRGLTWNAGQCLWPVNIRILAAAGMTLLSWGCSYGRHKHVPRWGCSCVQQTAKRNPSYVCTPGQSQGWA